MKIRGKHPATIEVAIGDACSTVCNGHCRANAVLDLAKTTALASRL